MQNVAHILDYYETQLLKDFLINAPAIPTSAKHLRSMINYYNALNAETSWLDELQNQNEIPFDPPYRTIRQEDAFNKLLEAEKIDPDD